MSENNDDRFGALCLLVLVLFLVSLFLPAARFEPSALSDGGSSKGYAVAFASVLGLIALQPFGFANPFFLIAWFSLIGRRWVAARIWGSLATVSAASVLIHCLVPYEEYTLLPGYYVWLSSMSLLTIVAFAGLRRLRCGPLFQARPVTTHQQNW